jgi:hypothetical protein
MPQKLSEKAVEKSSYTVRFEFNERTPSGLVPFVPNSGLIWSLVDEDGQTVNSKKDIPIDPPAQTVDVVLKGDDLALADGHPVMRYVSIEGTYNGTAGNDLPMIDEASFQIVNIKGKV